jgi:hypothetical protein
MHGESPPGEALPREHGVHDAIPVVGAYVPEAHDVQLDELFAPTIDDDVPAAHKMHVPPLPYEPA